jgi:asparagine synthase (glutamine-hydrolysing)
MCGIAGQVTGDRRPVQAERIAAMGDSLQHRGPDDHGIYLKGHVGLAHRRLSVLDLTAAGRQPMSNEDGTVWLVLNGEIYNHQELRDQLKARYRFQSRTDTEVLLHLYEEHGLDCLPLLIGMFAFALWDDRAQRLVLGRDRLGKKPLFYALTEKSLLFASEIRALVASGAQFDVDPIALHHYLTFQYVPTPQTIFRGVHKLPPGHVLIYENGQVTERAYWSLQYDKKATGRNETEYIQEFRTLLRDAVRRRLTSDVPIGAFLSGGADSSTVVGLMASEMTQPVKTFSIGFQEVGFDERPHAREIASRFGTEHHEFVVDTSAVGLLPELARVYGEPYADASAIPAYHLAQLSRQFVTVALTGDGGDELLGGYPRYRLHVLDRALAGVSPTVRAQLRKVLAGDRHAAGARSLTGRLERLLAPFSETYLNRICYFSQAEKDWLYTTEFKSQVVAADSFQVLSRWFEEAQASDLLDQMLSVDTQSYLPDDLLVKLDRATMAHGLEARCPFLDHRLVEFAAALPTNLKICRSTGKYLLKAAMRDMLPEHILHREKQGFAVPLDAWFRGHWREVLQDTLLSPRATGRGYFQPMRVQELIDRHQQGQANYGYHLYALLMLELWHEVYVDDPARSVSRCGHSVVRA